MKPRWKALALAVLAGCGTTGGLYPPPSSVAAPPAAAKWVGPWMSVPGGQWRAAFFYGPWRCNQRWMDSCRAECAEEGHVLQGCMWLADMKLDWKGQIVPPVQVDSGGRLAIVHCCCDYPVLSPKEKKPLRDLWDAQREAFRKKWADRFGNWPTEGDKNWPGHHIRDLQHGGDPLDPNNILPAPFSIHSIFNEQYPICYAGGAPWNTVGPDLPYSDE